MTSPAERYAASRRRAADERTVLHQFRQTMSFELDEFQLDACRALEAGHGVLVAAPTGAGKTVVGEFAVYLGISTGRKTFYTTPIKALSNQKYFDLAEVHGRANVGLLTGDSSINSEAPVVVMTTEVLRNMLYAESPTLDNLGFVVMDEVHYLADRFRGPVWEEVILHLPEDVAVVSLSATVSNAEEFGGWLAEVRGETDVIVSERRPVPLWQHMMVGSQLHDLYSVDVDPTDVGPDPPLNPDLIAAINRAQRARGDGADKRAQPNRAGSAGRGPKRGRHYRGGTGRGGGGRGGHGGRGNRGGRDGHSGTGGGRERKGMVRRPMRHAVVERLDHEGLLPAIVFIFSRAACDDAVSQVMASGIRLTTNAEAAKIREIHQAAVGALDPADLAVLGYDKWAAGLERGVAAHHAGHLPLFKETVERLFAEGLVKLVYATETLALGINMPARSVVIERLVKWDGSAHQPLTPGEYTQLTGRAGRRGIDVEGHGVVLYSEEVDPAAVAGLASRRTYPLRSAFRPTYNMAVNLLQRLDVATSRDVLESSFAQFQADRSVVGLARQLRRLEAQEEEQREAVSCHLGDFTEYALLREELTGAEAAASRQRKSFRRRRASESMEATSRGDLIAYRIGRQTRHAVVIDHPGNEEGTIRVVDDEKRARQLSATQVPDGVNVVGTVKVPKKFNPRNPHERRDLTSSLRNALHEGRWADADRSPAAKDDNAGPSADVEAIRAKLTAHPCHGCPEREDHARHARRWLNTREERRRLERRVLDRTASIAKDFDKVCELLTERGYLDFDPDGAATVTEDGRWLARVYAERDLLVAEVLRKGFLVGLQPEELAAALSVTVVSTRGPEGRRPAGMAAGGVRSAVKNIIDEAELLSRRERELGLFVNEELDASLVASIHAWASGQDLTTALNLGDIGAGDFVRQVKQLIDLLDQVSKAAPEPDVAEAAWDALRLIRRGAVGWSSV